MQHCEQHLVRTPLTPQAVTDGQEGEAAMKVYFIVFQLVTHTI